MSTSSPFTQDAYNTAPNVDISVSYAFEEEIYCWRCGFKCKSSWNYCPKCGAELCKR
ncbi:MAG: hypothetical protein DRN26_00560 [Thermoplasmata archaeon]|nr:MAG: hypothetical protein DRN26_00560 [Thermoplasmata archaeon]